MYARIYAFACMYVCMYVCMYGNMYEFPDVIRSLAPYLLLPVANLPTCPFIFLVAKHLFVYRSIYLFVLFLHFLPIYVCMYVTIDRSIYTSIHPSIHRSVYLSLCLVTAYISVGPSVYLSAYLSIYQSVAVYVCIYIYTYIQVYTLAEIRMHVCIGSHKDACPVGSSVFETLLRSWMQAKKILGRSRLRF